MSMFPNEIKNEGVLHREGGNHEVIDVDAGGYKVRSTFEFTPSSSLLTFVLVSCHRRSRLGLEILFSSAVTTQPKITPHSYLGRIVSSVTKRTQFRFSSTHRSGTSQSRMASTSFVLDTRNHHAGRLVTNRPPKGSRRPHVPSLTGTGYIQHSIFASGYIDQDRHDSYAARCCSGGSGLRDAHMSF